jgi:hypothetical protein
MSFFGPSYPQHGLALLMLLAISAVPDAITCIYVSLLRVRGRLRFAAFLNLTMAGVSLALAWILLPILGIAGAGWAWLIAQSTGTLIAGIDMLVSRSREAWPNKSTTQELSSLQQREPIWLTETVSLPAISQNYVGTQAISLIDTLLLPAMRLTAKGQAIRVTERKKLANDDEHHQAIKQRPPLHPKRRSYHSQANKLKPIQLRPYAPRSSRIPVTDPGVESQSLEN